MLLRRVIETVMGLQPTKLVKGITSDAFGMTNKPYLSEITTNKMDNLILANIPMLSYIFSAIPITIVILYKP
jgi:hypothetical protein